MRSPYTFVFFFFFNDTATTEIYTLSLHDALPISTTGSSGGSPVRARATPRRHAPTTSPSSRTPRGRRADRKSTRLNSSHLVISYAVFCLKKKNLGLAVRIGGLTALADADQATRPS